MPGAETFRAFADAYDRLVGSYGPPLAEALIAFAQVEPGMRALDVGCGPGALTAVLAERLGTANVCAADPSESRALPRPAPSASRSTTTAAPRSTARCAAASASATRRSS